MNVACIVIDGHPCYAVTDPTADEFDAVEDFVGSLAAPHARVRVATAGGGPGTLLYVPAGQGIEARLENAAVRTHRP